MSTTRVHFSERQLLTAGDLNTEQADRLARRRRHNASAHVWGIVTGLALDARQDGFLLQPGMAVDGYGRELVVTQPVSVPWLSPTGAQGNAAGQSLFDQIGSVVIDVWLVYGRMAETPPQRGRWVTGQGQHSRWTEAPLLRLSSAMPDVVPRKPAEVDAEALDVILPFDPPDDPQRMWPVYLGRITRSGLAPAYTYTLDASGRPYAALVAETVTAIVATGRARMVVGTQQGASGQRFAVGFAKTTGAGTTVAPVSPPASTNPSTSTPDLSAGAQEDRLTIDSPGITTVSGDTVVSGTAAKPGSLVIMGDRALLSAEDIIDPAGLAIRLQSHTDQVAKHVHEQLAPTARRFLAGYAGRLRPSERLKQVLAARLNRLLQQGPLYDRQRFSRVPLRAVTRQWIARQPAGNAAIFMNRLLLEDAFADEIAASQATTENPWGIEFRALAETPKVAAPWQIYHTVVLPPTPPGTQSNTGAGTPSGTQPAAVPATQSGSQTGTSPGNPPGTSSVAQPGAQANAQAQNSIRQLRLEIGHPNDKGNPIQFRLVIGHRDTQDQFVPCLTVRADHTVIAHTKINARRQVIQGPIQADLNDPRFGAAILTSAAIGVAVTDILKIDLTLIPPQDADPRTVTYSVKVTNSGDSAMNAIQVYENVTFKGVRQRQGSLGSSFSLGAGASKTIQATFAIPSGSTGEVIISVVVLGVGAGNQVFQASDSKKLTIS